MSDYIDGKQVRPRTLPTDRLVEPPRHVYPGDAGPEGPEGIPGRDVNAGITFSAEAAISSATTLTSINYQTVLELTNVPVLPWQFVYFDVTSSLHAEGAAFTTIWIRVAINGNPWRSAARVVRAVPGDDYVGLAISGRIPVGASGLVAGLNTFSLQWRATDTIGCDPSVDGEHAVMRAVCLNL